MGKLQGLHEQIYVGDTQHLHVGVNSGARRIKIVDHPSSQGPSRFLCMADVSIYIRQGDKDVTASALDMTLFSRQPLIVVVDTNQNNFLSIISLGEGTFKCTRIDSKTPAADPSREAPRG